MIDGPEAQAGEGEDIRRILARLAPRARACLLLQLVAGLSQRDIAAVLHISEKSVSAQVSRGREQFRQLYYQARGDQPMKQNHLPSSSSQPCSDWVTRLSARHQQDLTAEEWQALQQHLATCPACRQRAAEYEELDALITSQLMATRPLAGLPAALQGLPGRADQPEQAYPWPSPALQRAPSPHDPLTRGPRSARLARRLNLVAALLVVAALLGGFVAVFHLRSASSGAGSPATLPSTSLYLVLNTTQATGTAYRLNASDGSVRWHQPIAHQAVSTPLVAQDTL